MSFENPDDTVLKALLRSVRHIAVVGLSPKPDRPSFGVARAMQRFGYHIIPVRPAVREILGEPAYARLEDVPDKIDLVNVFRAPEYVEEIVDTCLALGVGAIWLQEGVVNDAAAERARVAGMTVIMDRCLYKEYLRLIAADPVGD